jgi:DNA-binding transcriptional ArsR family regulator
MPAKPFKPAARFEITKLETVRVLADPLRLRLIETMASELDHPFSVKELAKALGEPPTKLYYHVNMLEENGLLVVTSSQLVSGILEKRYQLVAASIGVDRALLTAGDSGVGEALHGVLTTIFSTAEEDVQAAIKAGIGSLHAGDEGTRERIVLSKSVDRLSPAAAKAFRDRLDALITEFGHGPDDGPADPDAHAYGLVVAFYPMADAPTRAARSSRSPRTRRTSQESAR